MAKPVRIFIDRKELIGYTSATLNRVKDQMTGTLTVELFMGYMPNSPMLVEATKGKEILVYVGNMLAFTGVVDRRTDKGDKTEGGTTNLSIGADSYTVTFTARGKTKYLVDSSHQHPTGTILRTTNKAAFELLIAPWDIALIWEADVISLDRVRLRDGGRVIDELQRLCLQCSLYMHETSNGSLRVTDAAGSTAGESIALGTNILRFQTDQSEDADRSEVTVKGQLTDVKSWGTAAVIPTVATVINDGLANFSPITVQLFGNATPELIQKRAQYEVNRRSATSKRVEVDVFHVQQSTGAAWDIGALHQVRIPPAGVNDLLEVIELTYNVGVDSLTTSLVLSPPPFKAAKAGGFMGAVGDKPGSAGWTKPGISIKGAATATVGATANNFLGGVATSAAAPPASIK
jgi:prophage tail gpP-like protein